jgi:energy-converting hydrogenase A subunit R
LKAYGATNQNMEQFSSRNVLLIPGAQETLSMVNNLMPSFIVSTSYEPYIRALCDQTQSLLVTVIVPAWIWISTL